MSPESSYLQPSFSQEGEDLILNRIFVNKQNGFYIDVGAHHPFRFSNTYIFYRRGWRGINIDPNPGTANLFNQFRPGDINLEIAIGEKEEVLTFYIFNEPGLNTFDPKLAQSRHGLRGEYFITNTVPVNVFPLSKILDNYLPKGQKIDFLNIDVEGKDFEVLKSNNWEKYRPKIILVEILNSSLQEIYQNPIFIFLQKLGYTFFAKTYNTCFFIENEFAKEFNIPTTQNNLLTNIKQIKNFEILALEFGQLLTIEKNECINKNHNPIPWLTYPAIEYLNSLDFSQCSIFEFGSGYSTLFWMKRAKEIVSVEHDKEWYEKIKPMIDSNVSYLLKQNEFDYVNTLTNFNRKFDVYVIDGRWRAKCIQKVLEHIKSFGGDMLIFDNSDWYPQTLLHLRNKLNWIEVDFNGFGPINDYTWTTSIFINPSTKIGYSNKLSPIGGLNQIADDDRQIIHIKNPAKAPIVLFTYNRLWHTKQTVEALQKNLFAQESELFIFSDGPKTEKDEPKVKEVREYLKTIKGFKNVEIIERDRNWGLANNIIDGITRIVNEYGKIIVLEDDIVTSPYFLKFMNEALNFYENNEKAMHISGYMFPVEPDGLPDVFFLKPTTCWGWATWKRAWEKFEKNPAKQINLLTKEQIFDFNLNNSYDYWSHLVQNLQGKINTWAIFWYLSVYLNGGLSLHPRESLTKNIGTDGTGVHTTQKDTFYDVKLSDKDLWNFPSKVEENLIARARLEKSYNNAFKKNQFISSSDNLHSFISVPSPITKKSSILLHTFDVGRIIKIYLQDYSIDVRYLFNNINKIYLYLCPDTGLMFFFPTHLEGDAKYYESLSKIPWYYMDWKWEHQIAFDLIPPNSEVLEIGCGKGSFLKKLIEKNCRVAGLEKSSISSQDAQAKKLNIYVLEVEDFAERFPQKFDYVCAFQTLEHIANVKSFINFCLKLLKPNGKLIFSVPNQESFISLDLFNIFDIPPHHLTRWTPSVFERISSFFPMSLVQIIFEPLQEYHIDWFNNLVQKAFRSQKLIEALQFAAKTFPNKIRGHTMIGIFQKTGN
jgi:FkbM family methyltransferase